MATEHYTRPEYFRAPRFYSYAHQLASVYEVEPETVLEVGAGSGYVKRTLEAYGVRVTTLDIQQALEPDLLGSVTDIPAMTDSFDVVSCCQVLEHLPFGDVRVALRELGRVARRRVVISVPDVTRSIEGSIRAPKIGQRRFAIELPSPVRPLPAERTKIGHRWEIGYEHSSFDLRKAMESAGLKVERSWRVPELPWHHFFILTPA